MATKTVAVVSPQLGEEAAELVRRLQAREIRQDNPNVLTGATNRPLGDGQTAILVAPFGSVWHSLDNRTPDDILVDGDRVGPGARWNRKGMGPVRLVVSAVQGGVVETMHTAAEVNL